MAIGPDARYSASGRIVVVAALQGVIGFAAGVIGVGPFLEGAGVAERVLGSLGVALGAMMVVTSASLGLRVGPARRLGMLGGWAMVALGAVVVGLATSALDVCHAPGRAVVPCYLVIGAIGLAGICLLGVGIASVAVVSRAPADAFRRRRR